MKRGGGMATRRLVGVLGGMGPMATVDFLAKVIALTPARCDQEHVPLIVHQVPQIPDRSRAILHGSDAPLAPMLMGLQRLAHAGAEFAVIPCNTAHHWYDALTRMQSLRIVHIAEATKLELRRSAIRGGRVALLATRGTHRAGVYVGRLGEEYEPLLAIDDTVQELIDRSIAAVKAGDLTLASRAAGEAAERMLSKGADSLILACTELPIALTGSPMADKFIDSTLALARLCVKESMREGVSASSV